MKKELETDLLVNHQRFDWYFYKIVVIWEKEVQSYKISKSWNEKCIERCTFSTKKLRQQRIDLKIDIYKKDLNKKAYPRTQKSKKPKVDILERWPVFII